ncbi:LacI family DNA-binding transcriptional regulator [Microbacterium sp. ET2]|uniref:LacI family DNA-binding transcriptional regulator n=1 Tax=Microbacterium albipurpureum TaxID=3050384 RepID=UPI00259CEA09|nr:LacI family DNA-binding transcriptional regulator [Microbacterium sp. ET2 (Ac-2212)]WJL97052.1 LacI family DNA-binding transcriptional regulator [Microbacterium sp. ET2 (Ac-2212)]
MPEQLSAAAPRRVTLKDVARASGVTASTVSKVVNGRRDVGPEARQRVLDTIDRLGFHPNSVARGLRMQRSDTLAIVTDDLEGIFTNAMMRGVEDAASSAGFGVFLCNSYGDRDREQLQLQRLLDKRVDALIFMSGNRVGRRPEPALPLQGTPYVYLYEYGDAQVSTVLPDDVGGGALAATHLVDAGASRIAFINGPREWEATADRLHGFTRELTALGHPFDRSLLRWSPSWNAEDGYFLANELMDIVPDLDAIFCGSDDLATGAMAAVHDRGLSIPDDVQIVGFDDRSLAEHQRPPLTTIALPLHQMGHLAGEQALASLERTTAPAVFRVPCELVVRKSTRGG